MSVKLLTKHHLECLSLKDAAQTRLSLHMSNAEKLEITCHDSNGYTAVLAKTTWTWTLVILRAVVLDT